MLTLQYLYDKYDYNIIVMILLLIDLSVWNRLSRKQTWLSATNSHMIVCER